MRNPRPRVAFVVNGGPDSAMAERATAFASCLADRYDSQFVFRRAGKLSSILRMLREIARTRPSVCYVLDLAVSGVVAAGLYKHATGTPFILDTGDAVVELGRVLGRGRFGVTATRAMEAYALRAASAIVVRGSYHKELLARKGLRAEFIPDGVFVERFAPPAHRPRQSETSPLVVGLVGSSVWVPSRQTCYGWELVEVVRLLKARLTRPVHGLMIGDGSGIAHLRRLAKEHGIEEQIEFAGRLPYSKLPDFLQTIDVCLSTQTDDVIGNVRTTGKLPLYLAAGRFVLASRVGEAARVLPDEMLVDFHGSVDPDYPARLAQRISDLVAAGTDFSQRPDCIALARRHFEYDCLSRRVAAVLERTLEGRR
jgi:glycosyltransferase involved in cell wall biosynthesis